MAQAGRPKLDIDAEEVEKLVSIGATVAEIADWFGCSKDTIERRFQENLTRGRAGQKVKLRQAMYKAAVENENTTMMIWLSKQWLGMKEPKQEIDFTNGVDGIDFADDNP